jgi:hypothetical protein
VLAALGVVVAVVPVLILAQEVGVQSEVPQPYWVAWVVLAVDPDIEFAVRMVL